MRKNLLIACLLMAMLFTACAPAAGIDAIVVAATDEPVVAASAEPALANQDDNAEEAANNDVYYINNEASMMSPPSTLYDLCGRADFVVTGNVNKSETVFQNDTMYTVQTVAVESAFKGGIDAGSEIYVIEVGGRTTFGEYDENCVKTIKDFETGAQRRDENTIIVEGVNGYFPMSEGNEVLLFLSDTGKFIENIDATQYSIIGTYAGKLYKQDDQTYTQIAPSQNAQISFAEDGITAALDLIEDYCKEILCY